PAPVRADLTAAEPTSYSAPDLPHLPAHVLGEQMVPTDSPVPAATPAAPAPAAAPVVGSTAAPGQLSPLQRAIAIFVRPAAAWEGLGERAQWWIPMLAVMIVTLTGSALLYHRAQLPMILDAMEERVSSGQMTSEQLQRIEEFYSGPSGLALTLGTT